MPEQEQAQLQKPLTSDDEIHAELVKKVAEATNALETFELAHEAENVEDKPAGRAKPQFTVKSKEGGYVGSGWMRDGQYGRYLALTTSQDIPKGCRLYVSPTRAAAGVLG